MTRREQCATVIRRVLKEHPELEGKELRRALFDAYPFGGRECWPYKVWCEEVRLALKGSYPMAERTGPIAVYPPDCKAVFPSGAIDGRAGTDPMGGLFECEEAA